MKLLTKVIWLFLLLPGFLFASPLQQISNKWVTLTDMKKVQDISVSNDKSIAFCATSGGLYVVDLINNTILKKYTNTEGLLFSNTTAVYTDSLNRVWIGCIDGSISVLNYNTGSFTHIYDIRNSSEINKSINSFTQYRNYMFCATSYGIQKISMNNFSFVDAPYYQLGTYINKTKVNVIKIVGDKIYAGTTAGLAYARLIANLNNPASWLNFNGFLLNNSVISIESMNNLIFFGSVAGMMYYNNVDFLPYPNEQASVGMITSIKNAGNKLYFVNNNTIYYADTSSLSQVYTYRSGNPFELLSKGKNDSIITTVSEKGISYFYNNSYNFLYPNSPNRNYFDWVSIDNNGIIWIAGGQPDAGFYKYDGNTWTNFTLETNPELGSNNFRRIIATNNAVWALGYGGGPTQITSSRIKNYNPSNSNLPGIPANPNFNAPFGGAFDNNGNFWISFFATNTGSSLYAYTGNDSVFIPYPNPSFIGGQSLSQMSVDNYNTKWIVSSSGVYFYNENGTMTQYNDDIFGFYSFNEIGSQVLSVSGIIVEKNNEVWISTNNGIFIISNPLAVLQNPNNKPAPTQMRVISGNISVPFIENCTAINFDILNQKWVGTSSSGVFHFSADGSTQLENFTTRNSPIISDQITALAISNKDGKAYFCSNYGLSQLQTDAVAPVSEFDKIICMPNPFVIPSNVNVRIDGLAENSSVKILSLSGDVMTELETPGGRIATWDGKDSKGKYVASGVYLVVGFTKDGGKVGKGKIVIIKK